MAGTSILTKLAVQEADLTGLRPHEWLAQIAMGMPVKQMVPRVVRLSKEESYVEYDEVLVYPNLETRIDCAKASSQFFAPKFTAIKASIQQESSSVSGLTDDELDELLLEFRSTDKEG